MPKKEPGLTPIEKNFCEQYVKNGGNGTKAISAARKEPYKKEDVAAVAASRVLRKIKVQEYIRYLQERATDSTIMSRKEVLRRLTNLGRAKMSNLAKWGADKVELKNSEDLEDDVLETVQEVSQKSGKIDEIKIKQYDKIKALELLAKHHGVLDAGSGSGDDSGDRESFKETVRESVSKLRK